MKNYGIHLIVIFLALQASDTRAQSDTKFSVGYNTFNEVYAGFQIPYLTTFELGYQFALTEEARYNSGPFDSTTPFLTNNAKGIRIRAGYPMTDNFTIYVEYQNLKSNNLIYAAPNSRIIGSEFKESYSKYGIRISWAIPISTNTIYFTYSFAFFYMDIHRKYSMLGNASSDLEVDFEKFGVQLNEG